jgi:Antibiotic biosynthesis monooxygenase
MSNLITPISVEAPLVTLVNVFTVEESRQAELVDALDRATREVFVGVPGFISANIHASLDGACVINYAQWADEQHFNDMQERSDVRSHIAEVMTIAAKAEPRLFRVRSIHHPVGQQA